LIVDSASEVLKIPAADVEASPKVLHENELNCVTGLGKYKGRLIVLLDITRLLDVGVRTQKAAVIEGKSEDRRAAAAK
jgi:purine-binding chemotaxis protein CheW